MKKPSIILLKANAKGGGCLGENTLLGFHFCAGLALASGIAVMGPIARITRQWMLNSGIAPTSPFQNEPSPFIGALSGIV